jgi:hypothetical protein
MTNTPSLDSPGKSLRTESFPQKLWRWFIAPSPLILERDQRRQAALLSTLLLALMIVGILVESITVVLINQPHYTGYRDTIVAVFMMVIVYGISRTRHIRPASILAVLIAMAAVFVIGWAQPYSVLGGLLDYLLLPLWLGSLYLSLRELVLLLVLECIGLLVFPLLTPGITLNDILVGPFNFVFAMSILLIVLTRHRNLLELDRRAELIEKRPCSGWLNA